MTLLGILFGIWSLLVLFTPFGLWSAKARIKSLEKSVSTIELELTRLRAQPTNPSLIQPIKEIPQPEPIVVPPPPTITPTKSIAPELVDFYAVPEAAPTPQPIRTAPKAHTSTPASTEPFLPAWVMRSLTGGRLFVTLGLGLLFIGVAMLFKYASHYIQVPIELRLIGVALGACALIGFGHKQMQTRRDYGLYLQGGGLGILFLTIFVAFKFYALLSPPVAFALLAIVGLSTFAFSMAYNAMPLAVLAITGGFLAPILTAASQGSHIGLFSYYLLLNLIIFAIAWKQSWRLLNSIGFGFTFIIGLMWGGSYYVPEFYPSVQAFLIAYFLLYVGIGVLFASREKPNMAAGIDMASIFGVPLIGFSLQIALTQYFPNGQILSCIGLGAFYSVASTLLRYSERPGWILLSKIFAWFSVLFFTLAIPFVFDAQTTAPLWAIEGVAMLWMLGRTKQKLYGYAGATLIFVSNIFTLHIWHLQGTGIPFANGFFISALILALSHMGAAYLLHPKRSSLEGSEVLATIFSAIGLGWWFVVGAKEIAHWLSDHNQFDALLIFYSLSSIAAFLLYKRFSVALFNGPIVAVMPLTIAFCIIKMAVTGNYHPMMSLGYITLPITFATHYAWLWQTRDKPSYWPHMMGYVTFITLCGFELGYQLAALLPTIMLKFYGWLLATLVGILLLALPENQQRWPLTALRGNTGQDCAKLLILWAILLCMHSFIYPGVIYGSYVPLCTPVDMMELLTIVTFAIFYRKYNGPQTVRNKIAVANGALLFLFINAVMLRTISTQMNLKYLSPTMFDSVVVQTALTILWTLIAMATMLTSSKRASRMSWFVGAALLAVVVGKLFLVDLAGTGTLSRIISFMGVGLLTILLGYFSPIPPKKEEA